MQIFIIALMEGSLSPPYLLSSSCPFLSNYLFILFQLISSAWHETVGQLIAYVCRIWKKKKNEFVVFDALGEYLDPSSPLDPLSHVIQRMVIR